MDSLFKKFLLMILIASESCIISCSILEHEDSETMVHLLTTGLEPNEWDPVSLQTSLGVIKGKKENSTGHRNVVPQYYAFRGIPYALPPVDELRFADPIDATSVWPGGHFDGTAFRSVCSQFDFYSNQVMGDEDCLYLNIFTPVLPDKESKHQSGLPVLVYIHGGAYLRGSSSVLSGGRLAGQNIILVTFNYRLGALGFLSTEDEVIPGNFGLLDQVSALRWVKRHIAEFGGDPNKVTIGGFSAGSASAHMHMMSPLSKGLIRGVLMSSGSAYSSWNHPRRIDQTVNDYAKQLMCSSGSSKKFKECLVSKTQEELLRAQATLFRFEFWPMPFVPIVDAGFRRDPFLPGPLKELETPTSLPVLMSQLKEEGLLFAINCILLSSKPSNPKVVYDELARYLISSFWFRPDAAERMAEIAESLYFSEKAKTSLDVLFEELAEILNDYLFHAHITEAASRLATNGNPVYTYVYSHRTPTTPLWAAPLYERIRSLGVTSPLLDSGTTHGDNLRLIFTPSRLNGTDDEFVADIETRHWVNFVINGKPDISEEQWPMVHPGYPVLYYNISLKPHMQDIPYKAKESNFWLQTLPLVERMNSTRTEDRPSLMPWIIGLVATYIIFAIANRKQ